MTKATRQGAQAEAVLFEGVFDKPLKVEFTAEQQSDFGGVPLFGALDRTLGLTAALAAAIDDRREPGKVVP